MGKVGIRIVLFLEGIKMGLYIHRNDLAKRKKIENGEENVGSYWSNVLHV